MASNASDRQQRLERLAQNVDTWFGACGGSHESAAIVETAFLMAAADGRIRQVECEQLRDTIAHVTGDLIDQDRLRTVLAQLLEMLQLDGWDARLDSVARAIVDPEMRRFAYRLAAGVSFIDGSIHEDELRLFGLLAESFQIPTGEATQLLVEVRDSLFGPPDDPSEPVLLLTPAHRRSRPE